MTDVWFALHGGTTVVQRDFTGNQRFKVADLCGLGVIKSLCHAYRVYRVDLLNPKLASAECRRVLG